MPEGQLMGGIEGKAYSLTFGSIVHLYCSLDYLSVLCALVSSVSGFMCIHYTYSILYVSYIYDDSIYTLSD